MADVTVSTSIDASVEQVWHELSAIEDHVEWMADAVAITFDSDQRRGVGTSFLCATKIGPLRTSDHMTPLPVEAASRSRRRARRRPRSHGVSSSPCRGGWEARSAAWRPSPCSGGSGGEISSASNYESSGLRRLDGDLQAATTLVATRVGDREGDRVAPSGDELGGEGVARGNPAEGKGRPRRLPLVRDAPRARTSLSPLPRGLAEGARQRRWAGR